MTKKTLTQALNETRSFKSLEAYLKHTANVTSRQHMDVLTRLTKIARLRRKRGR